MKSILPLIRIQLMEFFPVAALKNTADAGAKKRARRKLTSTVVIFLACVYMSGVYSMGMLKGGLDGLTYTLAPALMLMAGSVLGAITTLTKAGTVMFSAASLDPLLSLPLLRRTVVLSRVFSLYFEEFLINAGMLLIAGVCCQIAIGSLPAAFWPVIVLSAFLAPLLPLGLGGLVGLFVNMLTARMKNKSLFTTVFSMAFLLGVMFLSFNAGTLFTDMADIAGSLQARVFGIYPPARLFVDGLLGSIGSFLLFAGISLISLALLCLAAVKGFTFFYSAINATAGSKAFRMGRQKQSGTLLTLCKKELRQKYNTPIWIMNTDMGTVMAIVMTVGLPPGRSGGAPVRPRHRGRAVPEPQRHRRRVHGGEGPVAHQVPAHPGQRVAAEQDPRQHAAPGGRRPPLRRRPDHRLETARLECPADFGTLLPGGLGFLGGGAGAGPSFCPVRLGESRRGGEAGWRRPAQHARHHGLYRRGRGPCHLPRVPGRGGVVPAFAGRRSAHPAGHAQTGGEKAHEALIFS